MNRSSPWTSDGVKRYDREVAEGLKDKPKSSSHPELLTDVE